MKYIILFLSFSFISRSLFAQPEVIPPGKSYPTAFAIIIDKETYDHTKAGVTAYKEMLEQKEQLSVYIVSGNWQRPEEVRQDIQSLASRKPALEGAVFIGKVPVVLVRNAQHMTTAFKMDEIKFPMNQSSVASDRYYDDFDLKFRFVKKDDEKPGWFYYELEENSPQVINSDIYTARVISQKKGEAAYREISDFLQKAVAARRQPDPLDHLLAFTGGAYNSESLRSWADEQMALKELFPEAFKTAGGASVLNFRMNPRMKFELFSELQRPELDLALLSEHGAVTRQYINNSPAGNDFEFSYNYLRYNARNALRRAIQRGEDTNKVKAAYKEKYHLDDFWFTGALNNDSIRIADSLYVADTDIYTADLKQFTPQSRVIIFNACYNGSFHQPDNIAGAYIFSAGNTLVVQGNTVNVLQDKWAIEQMGLLNKGIRIGLWAYQHNTLESHLSGDPTWRFAGSGDAINRQIVLDRDKTTPWELLLAKNDPVWQALALKQLEIAGKPGLSGLLLKTYKTSSHATVRMQCLALLSRIGNADYQAVIPLALQDPYELIRRKAAEWIAKSGDDRFILPLVGLALQRPSDERVAYNIRKSLELMNTEKVKAVIRDQVKAAGYLYNQETFLEQWLGELQHRAEYTAENLATIKDKKRNTSARVQAIRMVRNSTIHHYIPDFIKVAEDHSEPDEIRVNMIEALGWFVNSYQKEMILKACERIQADSTNPTAVNKEALQTALRLQKWTLQ